MHHPLSGVQKEAKPQTVAKEANMSMIPKQSGKRKQAQVDFTGKTCWVGVDVHKSSYAVAILDEDGQRQEFSTLADSQRLLVQLLKMGMHIQTLVYESGPCGYGLAWACQEGGVPVVVAAPSRIPRPVSKSGKTDRLDSMNLVGLLARGMLKSIAIPSREEFAVREMERARQSLVRARRRVRQEIRSFLLRNALTEPPNLSRWSQIAVRALHDMPLPEYLQNSLAVYLGEHASILASLSRISAQLAEATVAQGHGERIKNLQTIPGVGPTIAHTFTCEIFRPERFKRAEDICAYVGLAPMTNHSGAGKERAWTRPVGQGYLRSILVESAWRLVAVEDCYRDFYNRIRSRTGLAQKAITAVARKLLVLIWRVAIEGRTYRPAMTN